MKKKYMVVVVSLFIWAAGMAGCQRTEVKTQAETTGDTSAEMTKEALNSSNVQSLDLDSEPDPVDPQVLEARTKELEDYRAVIWSHFPDVKFEPMTDEEIKANTTLFEGNYVFEGWKEEGGFSYIFGLCLRDENPLKDFVCSSPSKPPVYSASQFRDGQILLLESISADLSLLPIYEYLETGELTP